MNPEFIEANAAAIVIAVVAGLFVLLMLLALRRKRAQRDDEVGRDAAPTPAEAPRAPASKEVFAPLPAPPRSVEAEAAGAAGAKKAAEPVAKAEAAAKPEAARAEATPAEKKAAEAKGAEAAEAKGDAAKVAGAEAKKAVAAEAKKAAEATRAAEAEARAVAEAKKAAEAKAVAEAKKAAEAEAKAAAEAKKAAEAEAKAAAEAKEAEETPKTLRDGLGRTRKEGFIAKLGSLFAGKTLDQDLIDEVEEVLFTADIGVRTADRLLESVRESLTKKELRDAQKVWGVLRDEAAKILDDAAEGGKVGTPKPGEPFVTMVLGVNGSGKTTSIGKMAHQLIASGKRVTLIAGDTFRAAAAEQLEHWGRRVGAEVYRGKEGADPASVVFDGVRASLEAGAEHVLVDTAGRLQTQVNLMEELRKVRRVMGNAIAGAPHEVLMVLDATTGQNAISQAKLFKDATDVTGIILTKLDGTAKGGVVLGVCSEIAIPIKFVGIGERVADLRTFSPTEFVDELFRAPT